MKVVSRFLSLTFFLVCLFQNNNEKSSSSFVVTVSAAGTSTGSDPWKPQFSISPFSRSIYFLPIDSHQRAVVASSVQGKEEEQAPEEPINGNDEAETEVTESVTTEAARKTTELLFSGGGAAVTTRRGGNYTDSAAAVVKSNEVNSRRSTASKTNEKSKAEADGNESTAVTSTFSPLHLQHGKEDNAAIYAKKLKVRVGTEFCSFFFMRTFFKNILF